MGSYGNIVKTEDIRKKVEEGDFMSAQDILDTMDLKKVKNISDLNLFAEVFMENEKYDESAQLYMKIYEKYKSRKTTAQMVNISIKRGNVEDAENYLEEYKEMSPEDFDSYIYRYKIDKLKGASYEQLIKSLEALKKIEYTEKWSYELAKVYYKADMEAECIRECSDIILWFGEGTYVEKAKILRSYFSGEADKNHIMEEIKRRSEGFKEEETSDNPEENMKENIQESNPDSLEEDICSGSDFMEESGMDELKDGLMKDVQDILTNDEQEEEQYTSDTTQLQPEEQIEEVNTDEGSGEAPEQSAQEVNCDQPAYESQNEDDIRLNCIGKELGINPYAIFGNFLHVVSVKRQLVKSLETIKSCNTNSVFMLITGMKGSGKTTLAKDIALFLNKTGKIQSSKIAKISADKLNKVNFESKKDILKSSCLVIENAGELKQATINKILDLTESLQGDIAVIFEEDKKNMNKLFREYPKLMDLLKLRIHLPQYTQEDLLGFAYAGLRENDYIMDSEAERLLKDKVIQIEKQAKPGRCLEQIDNLIQSVINEEKQGPVSS